jgi:hypothetical protein
MEFGLSGAFADTLESVSARFSRVWLISLGSNSGTPLYLNPQARVNTILTHFLRRFPAGRDRTSRDHCTARCGSVNAQWYEVGQGPIAHQLSPIAKISLSRIPMVSVAAWDEASVNAQASA